MANIFTCRRPNLLGGGAIDHPDRSEQVPDQHYIPGVTAKIFKDDISMIHRQKTFIFGVLKAFISNFTYYEVEDRIQNTDRKDEETVLDFLAQYEVYGYLKKC